MGAFLAMLKHIAIYVALTLPGYLLVKTHVLKTERTGVLSKILLYIATPSLIVVSFVKYVPFDVQHVPFILSCVAVGIIFTLLLYFVSKPLARFESGNKRGMLRFCMCFGSLLSIPLAVAMFGASVITGTVTIVSSVMTTLMFPFGFALIKDDIKMINAKHFFVNPAFIGLALGIFLNLIHIQNFFPEIIIYPNVLSGLVTPVSMLILGMKLGGTKISSLIKSPRVYYVSAIRIVLFPTIITAILIGLSFIPALSAILSDEFIIGTFITFVMPTAGFSSTFAAQFKGDIRSSNAYPIASTYMSLVTLPILYMLLTIILSAI
ncbi:MAG: AEC family transporter [Clostridia bacterium]|nr:AEC family transporter [Clostridia bacterium]